jgi:hypothetical protein
MNRIVHYEALLNRQPIVVMRRNGTTNTWLYIQSLWRLELGYRGFLTSTHHYLDLSNEPARVGDTVVIFCDVRVPFILRETKPSIYRIVKPCYVHGIMEGELMETNPHIEMFKIH